MGTVRRVCRNVKRWRNAEMALRWTAAGMMEAAKGFRRLKAYKQSPLLKAALLATKPSTRSQTGLRRTARPHNFHPPATPVSPSSTKRGTSPGAPSLFTLASAAVSAG